MAPVLLTQLSPVRIDLARLEEDLDAIWGYYREIRHHIDLLPPLRETLRQTSSAALHASLNERASALGVATLRPDSILLLTELLHEEGLDMVSQLYGPHPATLHARDKQMLLPRGVHVQKTVSLVVGDRLVLVSSIGDRVLERAERFALAEQLGLSRRAARHATINPPGHLVEQELGLLRGMVSPFLPPGFGTSVYALVQRSWPDAWEDKGQHVAISLSPCESVLLPLRCYRRILRRYVRQRMPGLPLVELQAMELADAAYDTTGAASHAAT